MASFIRATRQKVMDGKYFFLYGGGLGDSVMRYINNPHMRKLTSIKEKHPNFEVHVYSQVHNNAIEDMFWYHPVITRHLQIVQLPQFHMYEEFDRSLILPQARLLDHIDHSPYEDREPIFNLAPHEQKLLDEIFSTNEPVTVFQPFAGMSDRDAFNNETLKSLTSILPGKKVIVGSNAPRVCVDRRQRIYTDDPSVIDLIDGVGIRFTYHLMKKANAFVGCHSCIVLLSWHFHKPTVCVLPMPHQKDHWERMDPFYKKGVGRENTLITEFQTHGDRCPDDFDYSSLDHHKIKDFLINHF